MLVGAAPGREPEQHLVFRNADMIGDHTGWKDPVRQVEMHQRPDAARSHSDVIACRRTLRHQPLPPGMIARIHCRNDAKLEHVPEKWKPVFREGHATANKARAHPELTYSGCALA